MNILNQILEALSIGLDALFPDIPIYPEQVPQKLPSRCFLIGFGGETQIMQEISGRYRISGKLDITYLPPEKQDAIQTRHEINSVAAAISLNLNVIGCGETALRLSDHTLAPMDDELHDLCSFTIYLRRMDTTPLINDISIDKEELK